MVTDVHNPGDSPLPDTPEVRAALADPTHLTAAARAAEPGWAEPYGGPEGIALLTALIRQQLDERAREMTALRNVAVAEMLRDDSLAGVARKLGIGKTGVHKLSRQALASDYLPLLTKGTW